MTVGSNDIDNLTFDIYLDNNENPSTLFKANLTDFYYTLTTSDLMVYDYNTFYWKIVAKDSTGSTSSDVFNFTVTIFKNANGRKLSSIECHDVVCKVGEVVVVGGVRRSALISLSNLQDDRMRGAKTGQWWIDEGQRALSNNSAAYTSKPDMSVFINEWKSFIWRPCFNIR